MNLPTLEEFKTFLKNRANLLETIEYTELFKNPKLSDKSCVVQKGQKPIRSFTATSAASTCSFCSGNHHLRNCDRFLKQSPHERVETVKKLQICINRNIYINK